MKGFFDYINGDSFLHKLDPITKIVLAFALCASCFISQSHLFVTSMIALDLALAAITGVFDRTSRILISLCKLSAALFLIQIFFVPQGETLIELPLGLRVTDAGISFSALFVARLIAASLPPVLMLSVTRMNDLSGALVSRFGIPYKYAFTLTTAIRFIPLLSDEMTGIMEAQTARGAEFDTKNFFKKIRLVAPICVPLLVSSARRMHTVAISAELRGFNLRTRESGYRKTRLGYPDAAAFSACVLITALSFMF